MTREQILSASPVLLVKFLNGMEIMGQVVEINDQSVSLKDIFQINYRISESGNYPPMISFTRFMMLSRSDTLVFPIDQILTTVVPRQAAIDYYKKACEDYVKEFESIIDSNVQAALAEESVSKEDMYKSFLEALPVSKDKMQ